MDAGGEERKEVGEVEGGGYLAGLGIHCAHKRQRSVRFGKGA